MVQGRVHGSIVRHLALQRNLRRLAGPGRRRRERSLREGRGRRQRVAEGDGVTALGKVKLGELVRKPVALLARRMVAFATTIVGPAATALGRFIWGADATVG